MDDYLDMWKRCFDFRGTTDRGGFWMAILGNGLILVTLGYVSKFIDGMGNGEVLCRYLLMAPMISMTVRRLRDGGHGWYQILWWSLPMLLGPLGLAGKIFLCVLLLSPTAEKSGNFRP